MWCSFYIYIIYYLFNLNIIRWDKNVFYITLTLLIVFNKQSSTIITEYSPVYSPLILLTEYANIITLNFIIYIIFSINPYLFLSISNNFECGFYSIIISSLRYRFNYWFILYHFIISEQELILGLLIIYGIQTLINNKLIIIIYIILFIDLFLLS